MTRLELSTDGGETWVRPGERLTGTAAWELDGEADAIEIRLFWYTSGKGSRDVGIVDARRFEHVERQGSRTFSFQIPEGPISFTGKLITLSWAIELVALPSEESGRLDLLVGRQPVEVDLRTTIDR